MRTSALALTAALAVALSGCASMNGLHTTGSLTDPGQLHASKSLAGVTLSPAAWPSQDWWTSLGDPQLDQLIKEALANNPSLAAADARTQQAQAAALEADAGLKPTVNAGASVAGTYLPTTVVPEPLGGHFGIAKYAYGSFSWSPDIWGGKRSAYEAAVGQVHAARIDAQAARLKLSGAVASAYVQLGYAFRSQDIAEDQLKRAQGVHKLTSQRVNAGIDSQLQMKQVQAEVAAARQQVAAAKREVEAARIALAKLLGKGPDRGLSITRPKLLTPAEVALPSKLPADLLGRRPDLVAARWRVEAARGQIKTAKTKFMPNLDISALAGFIAMGGGTNLFQMPARFYNVAPAVSLPIFEGGKLRANLKNRDAQYDEAVAQYNQTLVGALNDIADDVSDMHSLKQQIAAQQQAEDAASQAWQLAQERYQAGIGSYLQALTVRQQLLTAQQRMASLKSQQVERSIALIEALGGGYQPKADAAPTSTSSDHS
ncbi:efflux transporter outer membrane subunit [Oleiagrimonas sp. C23AA]|uniref:efflux transporter outer membrane subunit n=1 Tax=Oleiagrimonas sp. C23AA TaxID=2719047 RepID=UPI0014233456|nr:efflux transporter outer membrane subunit [Oleiagrimonas sp. C23AA]NII11320.1 efflux transporter outer membrane subunit [Oleiagrimonas sp. C23AA]